MDEDENIATACPLLFESQSPSEESKSRLASTVSTITKLIVMSAEEANNGLGLAEIPYV